MRVLKIKLVYVVALLLFCSLIINADNSSSIINFDTEQDCNYVLIENINSGANKYYSKSHNSLAVEINYTRKCFLKFTFSHAIDADKLKYIKIRYYVKGEYNNDASALIRLSGTNEFPLYTLGNKADGQWQEKICDLSYFSSWSGLTDTFEFAPIVSDDWTTGSLVYVDYIGFFGTEQEANDYYEADDTPDFLIISPQDSSPEASVKIRDFKPFVHGYTDTFFFPERNMTRAEATAIVSRLIITDDIKEEIKTGFSDVPTEAWYHDSVLCLESLGALSSFGTNFEPEKNILRGEFINLLYKTNLFKKNIEDWSYGKFNDVPKEHIYYNAIDAAKSADIVNGYDDGNFCPELPLTRAEAVVIINRALGVEKNTEATGTLYSDVLSSHWAYADIMAASSNPMENPKMPDSVPGSKYDVMNTAMNQWQQVVFRTQEMKDKGIFGGEGGQVCFGINSDREDGSLMFSFTDTGGVFRSTDGGKHWEQHTRGLYGMMGSAQYVAIDPNNKNRVIAICTGGNWTYMPGKSGLFLSEDAGFSYEQVTFFTLDSRFRIYMDMLDFDGSSYDKNIGGSAVAYWSVLAQTEEDDTARGYFNSNKHIEELGWNDGFGLYKTTDGGKTWKNINKDFANCRIKVHPSNGTVYVSKDDGFYISTDGGNTFKQTIKGDFTGLDIIHTYPDNVYLCDRDGKVYLSRDCGNSFSLIKSKGIPSATGIFSYYGLKVSPANPNKMLIAGKGEGYTVEGYFSHDGGSVWSSIVNDTSKNFFPVMLRDYTFHWSPVDENKAWHSAADWVCSSTDGGKTFVWDQNGNGGACINSMMAFNVYNPSILFVPIQDFTSAITLDGGDTWLSWIKYPFTKTGMHIYGGYAVDEKTFFFGHTSKWEDKEVELCITRDGGKTIEETGIITYLASGSGHRYSQSPTNPDVWFADSFRSADAGKTWADMNPNCSIVLDYNFFDKKELYGISQDRQKVMVSYDNGETWQIHIDCTENDMGMINDIAYDGQNDIMYITQARKSVSIAEESINEFVTGSRMISSEYKVFKYYKDGTKETLNEAIDKVTLQSRDFGAIEIDPKHPEIVYAGALNSFPIENEMRQRTNYDYSIVRSCDGGKSFQLISTAADSKASIVKTGPSGPKAVAPGGMCVNPETGELFVSTRNLGLWKLSPPY